MKILIFINSLGAGGAERSMVEFAKYLKSTAENSVKFVCLERRNIGLEKEVENAGLEAIYYSGSGSLKDKIDFFSGIISSEQPDILHSVLAESNLILRLTRLFTKKGILIQSLVNTPYSKERKKDTKLAWQKFLLAKQRDKWTAIFTPNIFYHAITHEVLNHYKPLFRIKGNYKVIYRGRYENKNLKKQPISDEFKIINVGRQEFAKGQIDILKALLYLREERNIRNIKLEILGRPGQTSSELEKFIRENDMIDQVNIEGFVTDVDKRLATSQAFIFPSYYEGLGGALIEAFAAKLPCICSNIPVLKEVVGNENGALFCPPGDFKCLGEHIFKLYNDKSLQKTLSDYSYSRFREKFRMESINKEMLNMYQELLKSR